MTGVDLAELRIDEQRPTPRRPLGPRLLGGAVIALLAAVALTFLWPLLRPVRAVTTSPIRLADAAASPTVGSAPVAEAVGWVEPEPFPIEVRPLVAGRIRELRVLEGDRVIAGETVIATLESAALLAARDRAAATLAERRAELSVAERKQAQSDARRRQLAALRTAVVTGRHMVASQETAVAAARGRARELAAAAAASAAALAAQQQLHEAGTGNTVALARARAEAAAAEAAATAAADTATASERELAAARTHLAVDEELAAEPVDLDTDLAVASAELERLRQRVAAAATELAIAERELGWAERVVAPVDGIVMRLDAMPGQTTGPGSGAIVALYDPNHLQARLDVPLDSVAEIRSGQDVELTSEITGKTVVAGEVLRIQHVTDLLKNTLQVKVRLEAPPAIWRPETLCRARFFRGLDLDAAQPAKAAATVFLVPKSTIRDGRVYVIEPAHGVARAIPVTVVGEDGDLAIVGGELSVTQRVIREAVADGEAVEEKQP